MTWLSDATTPRQLLDALATQVAELEGRIETERALRQQALARATTPWMEADARTFFGFPVRVGPSVPPGEIRLVNEPAARQAEATVTRSSPPVCPNCGNNRQVWVNQLTGLMTCHRIWCQRLGEVKAKQPTDTERLRWLCRTLEFDGLMDVEPDVHEYALEIASEKSHNEPTPEDYFEAYRRLIDAAMAKDAA